MRSHANVMATLAAFAALGGGAFAIGAIPDDEGDINACFDKRGKDIGEVRLLVKGNCANDERQISWNQDGPQGPVGPPGGQGPLGPSNAFEAVRDATPVFAGGSGEHRVATLSGLPPGAYTVSATARVAVGADQNPNLDIPQCTLKAESEQAFAAANTGGGEVTTLPAQLTHTFAGEGVVTLDCMATNEWSAAGRIIAIRVSDLTSTDVSG